MIHNCDFSASSTTFLKMIQRHTDSSSPVSYFFPRQFYSFQRTFSSALFSHTLFFTVTLFPDTFFSNPSTCFRRQRCSAFRKMRFCQKRSDFEHRFMPGVKLTLKNAWTVGFSYVTLRVDQNDSFQNDVFRTHDVFKMELNIETLTDFSK